MNLLKRLRKSQELSIREAATLIGVNSSTLQRIETGKQFPKEKTLLSIAKMYKIKPSEIVDCYLEQKDFSEECHQSVIEKQ